MSQRDRSGKESAEGNWKSSFQYWPSAVLLVLAAFSLWVYYRIALISEQFEYIEFETLQANPNALADRPVLPMLCWFLSAFVCYLAAVFLVWDVGKNQDPAKHRLSFLLIIIAAGVGFRVMLIGTTPIQEIDIYRYLWDGAAVNEGVSPFKYSPLQVWETPESSPTVDADLPDDLAKLRDLRDSSATLSTILSRVHFKELPTVYPPVSQAVFALATATTPNEASVELRLNILKGWLVLFDLGTLALVIALLHYLRRPLSECLIYAWCPLLMKEVANSGHLDAIAVFFTTAAIYCAVRALFSQGGVRRTRYEDGVPLWMFAAAILLALGVGAKIYPLILAPLLLFSFAKWYRWKAIPAWVTFAAVAYLVIAPMLPQQPVEDETARVDVHKVSWQPTAPTNYAPNPDTSNPDLEPPTILPLPPPEELPPEPSPPLPPTPPSSPPSDHSTPQDPSTGLKVFISRWEMNDFLFLIVHENLRPDRFAPGGQPAWFAVTPQSWRENIVQRYAEKTGVQPVAVPFQVTRLFTSLIYLAFALIIAWRALRCESAANWLALAFLTIAWFWLLSPTQNPWYWTWALPFLAFARARSWLLLAGLTFLYYSRYHLQYHYGATVIETTGYAGPPILDPLVAWIETGPWFGAYNGAAFFDLVVTWIEFCPWFGVLICETWLRRKKRAGQSPDGAGGSIR